MRTTVLKRLLSGIEMTRDFVIKFFDYGAIILFINLIVWVITGYGFWDLFPDFHNSYPRKTTMIMIHLFFFMGILVSRIRGST